MKLNGKRELVAITGGMIIIVAYVHFYGGFLGIVNFSFVLSPATAAVLIVEREGVGVVPGAVGRGISRRILLLQSKSEFRNIPQIFLKKRFTSSAANPPLSS